MFIKQVVTIRRNVVSIISVWSLENLHYFVISLTTLVILMHKGMKHNI